MDVKSVLGEYPEKSLNFTCVSQEVDQKTGL